MRGRFSECGGQRPHTQRESPGSARAWRPLAPRMAGSLGIRGAIVSLDDLLVHGPGHGVRSPSGEVSQVGEVHNRARTGRRGLPS